VPRSAHAGLGPCRRAPWIELEARTGRDSAAHERARPAPAATHDMTPMTRRAPLGDLNAAATDGPPRRSGPSATTCPGRRRDIPPAIPFHWIALGAGAAKRPPPPSACVPRWPGTSPSSSPGPLAALSVWARRLRWLLLGYYQARHLGTEMPTADRGRGTSATGIGRSLVWKGKGSEMF